ncbi:hypothetical protein HYO33_22865 [Vibrio parahaemolyticus]|nr:hypothetical protein [Vibrio parahaemolyticus]ELA9435304.1 hypothetical protein [Vibrio parahaemolyticus]MBM4950766.1 hypothetical protein [Vibrio parahaemolyticus]
MNISEKEFTDSSFFEFEKFAIELVASLAEKQGVTPIEWVDNYLYDWQMNGVPPCNFIDEDSNDEEIIAALAIVWAKQLSIDFEWQWSSLTFHDFDDWTGLAVVSPDRSLIVLPFAYIRECLKKHDEVKISASISALKNNVVPDLGAKSYINLMHSLHRILPRG